MTRVTMMNDLWGKSNSFAGMSLHQKLDLLIEGAWLLLIFLLPVYFNPFGYQVFYFAKSLLLQFGVCLLLGLYLARWFLEKHGRTTIKPLTALRRSPLQAAVIVFGLLWTVSTIFSVMPEASFWGSLARKNGLISNIAWIVLFLIIAQKIRRRSQIYRALAVLIVSAGLVSLFGILEFADPRLLAWLSRNGRVSSTDGNPLSLSGFIAMVIPVNLALVMITWSAPDTGAKKTLKITGLLVVFALQMICLYLAQYSITILLFIPGIFIFFLLAGICLKRKATLALSAAVLLALLLLAAVIVGQKLLQRTDDTAVDQVAQVGPVAPDTSVAGRTGLNTLGLRVKQWQCAINVILDSPQVPFYQDNFHYLRRWMGYGPEMLVVVAQTEYPGSMKSEDTRNSQLLGQPENHYLFLAVTVGLLGLAAFLAVILMFCYLGLRLLRKLPGKDVVYLASALIAGVAQYCVHILFNPTAILPEFMFWLILALMAALVRIELPGDGEPSVPAGADLVVAGTAEKVDSGKVRKAMAVLIIILSIGVGFSLTFSPALADMKLNSALNSWSTDANKTMSALAEAANLEPGQAVYYGYVGTYAFYLAIRADNTTTRNDLLSLSTSAYRVAGTREPYLAYWSYTIADVYAYWANHKAPDKWQDALDNYERADVLLPGDAVILNKWALALMLKGDCAGAGQKLEQSGMADGRWVQTIYYRGLLELYEHCFCTASYAFVYPVKEKLSDVGLYMNFCNQVSLYGGIEKVIEGLKTYTLCHEGDWVAQALLGTAELYDNRMIDASAALHKSAVLVPAEDIEALKSIVESLYQGNKGFQSVADDILYMLDERVNNNTLWFRRT